jgi:nitrite reductase (NO-forming)
MSKLDNVFMGAVVLVGLLVLVSIALVVALPPTAIQGITRALFPMTTPQASGGGPVPLQPTVRITLYAREFGFGTSQVNITSPGPTIVVHEGDVVELTLVNVGTIPHSFGIVHNVGGTEVLFDSGMQQVPPGESATIRFVATEEGTFYYQCMVPGHAQLGMWGRIIVLPPSH